MLVSNHEEFLFLCQPSYQSIAKASISSRRAVLSLIGCAIYLFPCEALSIAPTNLTTEVGFQDFILSRFFRARTFPSKAQKYSGWYRLQTCRSPPATQMELNIAFFDLDLSDQDGLPSPKGGARWATVLQKSQDSGSQAFRFPSRIDRYFSEYRLS
jgi:hypothetical protein